MTSRQIVVVGTSAGGVEALRVLLAQLPADFPAPLFITMHLAPDHPSHLPEILQRVCALPVERGADGASIRPGHVYVAYPNHHLMLERGRVRCTVGPKENRFRPAVDVLFRSAALAYGPMVTGIVLTGALDDGSAGLVAIKSRGGTAIVQDPQEADFPGMPQNALRNVTADYVLTLSEMGAVLERIVSRPTDRITTEKEAPVSKPMESEVAIALGDNGRMREIMALGQYTPFTCPECHGVLVKIKEGKMARFRCHTGHAFTLNHLLSEVTQYNEDILMNALRALEETELLLEHTSEHFQGSHQHAAATALSQKLKLVKKQAALVKTAAMENEVISLDTLNLLDPVENK